ncbi:hypothetical protein [Anaeroselena agilis]|uniref:Uncharacterized protein n=1 Tax=Anaeroselena agilis TaxID=3063788 RepID=A0ABU3P2A9_9FIRM|nr:hypothetical protein [Selenomonadales bacterium 4137-cl]
MKFPVYNVYRDFFGYPKGDSPRRSLLYILSIRDTIEIVRQVCYQKNSNPFLHYEDRVRKSGLTSKFLRNAKSFFLALEPDYNLTFADAEIWVAPKHLQSCPRGGVSIPVPYLISSKKTEIITLTFGRPENITRELQVLKGLAQYFKINPPWPSGYDTFSYWDLSTGTKSSTNFSNIIPVSSREILKVLNHMVVTINKSA